MAEKRHDKCVGFKNARSMGHPDVTIMHVAVDDVNCCDGRRMHVRKVKMPCINKT